MRRFIEVRTYGQDDTDFDYDAYNVALVDESGTEIMSGDWYHDKIDSKIEGFRECLEYLGIEHDVETVRKNDEEGIYG